MPSDYTPNLVSSMLSRTRPSLEADLLLLPFLLDASSVNLSDALAFVALHLSTTFFLLHQILACGFASLGAFSFGYDNGWWGVSLFFRCD